MQRYTFTMNNKVMNKRTNEVISLDDEVITEYSTGKIIKLINPMCNYHF